MGEVIDALELGGLRDFNVREHVDSFLNDKMTEKGKIGEKSVFGECRAGDDPKVGGTMPQAGRFVLRHCDQVEQPAA